MPSVFSTLWIILYRILLFMNDNAAGMRGEKNGGSERRVADEGGCANNLQPG